MAAHRVFFRKSVGKDCAPIPKSDLRKILDRIAGLAADPRPHGCEKLSAQERYRIRQGRYRIVYSIQDQDLTVWVVKVGHRRMSIVRGAVPGLYADPSFRVANLPDDAFGITSLVTGNGLADISSSTQVPVSRPSAQVLWLTCRLRKSSRSCGRTRSKKKAS
jgi:mRNA interferase RelE/StbE